MMKIELLRDGTKGLEDIYLKNGNLSHITGNRIKLMPFRTKFLDACTSDFQSFQGIVAWDLKSHAC